MLRIEVHTSLTRPEDPVAHARRMAHIKGSDYISGSIYRRSLDARPDRAACWVDLVDLKVKNEEDYLRKVKAARHVDEFHYTLPENGETPLSQRPIVVGFGPAGMAAGLALAAKGFCPIILERGKQIQERQNDVSTYWHGGTINPESNVQYGEGGAGAFSDGKLTTRVKDPRVHLILDELVKAGADPSIVWTNHPHVGTDALVMIDENIRHRIEELGGEVRFNARMDDLLIDHGKVVGVRLENGEEIPSSVVILALGHSARDTMRMLATKKDLTLEAKNFAVGVRVEHLQKFIDHQQYRNIPSGVKMPAAEYHLSHTSASTGKGVYSFCMCPGGYVVDGASMPDTVVTNGMSYAARDGRLANSAIVVQVDRSDFGDGLFAGMNFQENLEKRAWQMGNGKAPAQTIESYLKHSVDPLSTISPTFSRGVEERDLHPLFSDRINQSLEEFFHYTEGIWPGFTTNGATMTGVETRTSSPIRIVRDFTTLESTVSGVWPAGEGAGFAGGIVSSAIDGLKCAEEVIRRYHRSESAE